MKPGKPVFFGTKGRSVVFGVPGNPVSTYLTFMVFIRAAIETMMGREFTLPIAQGILQQEFRRKPGRKHFVPVTLRKNSAGYEVFLTKGYSGSADIASLAGANAFMIVDGSVSLVKKRSTVDVLVW